MKFISNCSLILAIACLNILSGCQDIHFTAPFCGPNSPDRTPEVKFPEGAQGCYRIAGEINFDGFTNSIIHPMISKDAQFIYIFETQHNQLKIGSSVDVKGFTGGVCPNPLDPSGNSRLTVSFDNGWWSASVLSFSEDRNSFAISHLTVDQLKLHESGIKYVLFPSANFLTEHKYVSSKNKTVHTSSSGVMLQSTLGITLIRNDEISNSELFTKANIESHAFAFTGTRVNDSFCMQSNMSQYARKLNHPMNTWSKN